MNDQPEQPQYPEYPPQYAQSPPPLPPKKGGSGKWIALGGCGCLFFLGVIAAVVFLVIQLTKAPMQAVNDHLKLLRSNEVEEAYNNCSSGFKEATSRQDFVNYVAGYPFFKNSTEFTSSNRKTENGVVILEGNVETADGSKHPTIYKLIKESGSYKIHYINVKEAATYQNESKETQPETTQPETTEPVHTEEQQPSGEESEPEIYDVSIDKTPSGNSVTVKINFHVKNFNNEHSGSTYTINLVQDLETSGPDGNRLDILSRDGIKTLNESGQVNYTSANFTNTLTIPLTYPQGTYTVHLKVHDEIGRGVAEDSTSFEFP